MPKHKGVFSGAALPNPDRRRPQSKPDAPNVWHEPDSECEKEHPWAPSQSFLPLPSEAARVWPRNERLLSFFSEARGKDCQPDDSSRQPRFWNWPNGKGFSAVLGLSLHPFVGRLVVVLAAVGAALLVRSLT